MSGLRPILLGLFKKIVADRPAIIVDQTYAGTPAPTPGSACGWERTSSPSRSIPTSAYSDIARGSARVLGVDLMKNSHATPSGKHPSATSGAGGMSAVDLVPGLCSFPRAGAGRRLSKV